MLRWRYHDAHRPRRGGAPCGSGVPDAVSPRRDADDRAPDLARGAHRRHRCRRRRAVRLRDHRGAYRCPDGRRLWRGHRLGRRLERRTGKRSLDRHPSGRDHWRRNGADRRPDPRQRLRSAGATRSRLGRRPDRGLPRGIHHGLPRHVQGGAHRLGPRCIGVPSGLGRAGTLRSGPLLPRRRCVAGHALVLLLERSCGRHLEPPPGGMARHEAPAPAHPRGRGDSGRRGFGNADRCARRRTRALGHLPRPRNRGGGRHVRCRHGGLVSARGAP